ncbi:MAG TPA: (d)CMP kinase [Longimicrobiales bacterium]
MIIAIDGPAGSGKSSTAKAVAARLGFRHLDSGAFYRTLTLAALQRAIPADTWNELDGPALANFKIDAQPSENGFKFSIGDDDVTNEIRSPEVNAHVSQMAAVRAVREWLLERLRSVAKSTSLVADGRDIGTVVFPQADLKIFLVAQSEIRARRRLTEQGNLTPSKIDIQNEVDRLGRRDRMDSQRAVAPLKQAEDAVVIDTTDLSFDEQVEEIVRLARERMADLDA